MHNKSLLNKEIKTFGQYQDRYIKYVNLLEIDSWFIKLYWITYEERILDSNLVDQSKQVIAERLKNIHTHYPNYKVGFAIIHEGKDYTFVIVSHWIDENMLDHIVFILDPNAVNGFVRLTPDTIITCIWELEVLYREKVAWTERVLKEKNINSYLDYHFSTTV